MTTGAPGPAGHVAWGPVLLVEDDDLLASILARHLRSHGYGVEVCPSVEKAVAALRLGMHPSLVVLDINLPDATGWSLPGSREMADAGAPPVLIASAQTVSPTRIAESGVAGYLPKPFALETFMDVVGRLARAREEQLNPRGDR
jgi:DNA-binding response OmpR family regulator